MQSVAVTLSQRLGLIEDPTCLPKWLITTTTRRCNQLVARRAREPAFPDLPDRADRTADSDPESEVHSEELGAHVSAALAELKPRDRELLLDLFVRELPYAEVAEKHGLAIGSLGSLRARALARLRKRLEERGMA